MLHLNLLTNEAFCQKRIIVHFGDFQAGYELKELQSAQKGIFNMTACLSFN